MTWRPANSSSRRSCPTLPDRLDLHASVPRVREPAATSKEHHGGSAANFAIRDRRATHHCSGQTTFLCASFSQCSTSGKVCPLKQRVGEGGASRSCETVRSRRRKPIQPAAHICAPSQRRGSAISAHSLGWQVSPRPVTIGSARSPQTMARNLPLALFQRPVKVAVSRQWRS